VKVWVKSMNMLVRKAFLLVLLFIVASNNVHSYGEEESFLEKIFNAEAFFENIITGFGIVKFGDGSKYNNIQSSETDYTATTSMGNTNSAPKNNGEVCNDGADNDGDGLVDCADYDSCDGQPPCGKEVCDDNFDNDGDGLIDCQEKSCKYSHPNCKALPLIEICGDGIDNDGDGLIDCADIDCASDPICYVPVNDLDDEGFGDGYSQDNSLYSAGGSNSGYETSCTDGIDDDGDGKIDCVDEDCLTNTVCVGAENCGNNVDDDGNGKIDCLDEACSVACSTKAPEICNNNIDDDKDGYLDCADPNCFGTQLCGQINIQGFSPVRNFNVNEIVRINEIVAASNIKLREMSKELKRLERIVEKDQLAVQDIRKVYLMISKIAGRNHRFGEEVSQGNVDTKTARIFLDSINDDVLLAKNELIDTFDRRNRRIWLEEEKRNEPERI
jgi:hypothetical protein